MRLCREHRCYVMWLWVNACPWKWLGSIQKKVRSWRRYSPWCLPPSLNLPVNKTKANQVNKIYSRSSNVTELDYNTTRLALASFLLGNVVLTRVAVWLKRPLAVWAAPLQQPWKSHRSVSGSSSSLYLRHPTTVRKSSPTLCPALPPPTVAAASSPPPNQTERKTWPLSRYVPSKWTSDQWGGTLFLTSLGQRLKRWTRARV